MAHRLQITGPAGERTTHVLTSDSITIGRSSDNDLAYPEDAGLSRRHLTIEKSDAEWLIRDLGSKNGTIINDQRLRGARVLNAGDRVRASRLSLVYEVEEIDPFEGTVIFDAVRSSAERPPMHTVTLGQLVAGGSTGPDDVANSLWADPVTALLRAGRELVARKPMADLFNDILALSLEAVGASRGVLLTLEGKDLRVRASRGDQFRISKAVRDRVMNERTSLLVGDVQSDEVLRNRQSIVLHQVHSLMAAPLQTDERVLGLIYVDTPHAWRQFSPADLNLLTVMANVAAMRIERERLSEVERARELMERDLNQAAEIQRQFLPGDAPSVEGLDLAGYNSPCRGVGGDYYDFVTLPDGRQLVVLGDVAGKGMPAALLMVNLQARVQLLAERGETPAVMVASLNRALHAICPDNRFVTFFLAQVDPGNGHIVFSNGGHNPPLLVRVNGDVEKLEEGGPVLGAFPSLPFRQAETEMAPGDSLVIYSDGVTEANNTAGDEYGEERFEDLVVAARDRSAAELVQLVCDDLNVFTGDAPQADDVTIVVVRRT